MWCGQQTMVLIWLAFGLFVSGFAPLRAADLEINRLLQSPVAKDWVTNGGNLTNQRYSTLKEIDVTNVERLKGAWRPRLKRSGFGTSIRPRLRRSSRTGSCTWLPATTMSLP